LASGPIALNPGLDGVEQFLIAHGLVRNSMAPDFIARTDIEMSLWPLMNITGSWILNSASVR